MPARDSREARVGTGISPHIVNCGMRALLRN